MKASQWIDRLRAAREWGSDYRVAKELQLASSTITRYRSKPESTMDDDVAIKVAEALGEPPAVVLIDQAAERTKSPRARAEILGALESVRGKLAAAGPHLRVAAGGGKARVDISSVTFAGGDPARLHRNTHRIEQDMEQARATAEAALLQMLANRFAAQSSYSPAFSRA